MSESGQVIITGIEGIKLTSGEEEFISKENIGGVILFSQNYESPEQLAELVNNIQKLRTELPLFVSVDNEGGRVFRFKKDFTIMPPMMKLALISSPKICYQAYEIMAHELKACGINLNLAPCCDVLTNPENKVIGDRAFGQDAETVTKFVSAAIRGLQTNGVLACAKHFPGHGSTKEDSHKELPRVSRSMEELRKIDLVPFAKAIKSSRVEFVMMAHLVVDCIDPQLPCSLSPAAHKLLRQDMKFNKIILSDDMLMKAITDHYDTATAAVMALNAGTDILVYRHMAIAQEAIEGIKQALKTKKIKNEIMNEKIKRINDCKKQFMQEYKPNYIPSIKDVINTRQSQIFLEALNKKISSM